MKSSDLRYQNRVLNEIDKIYKVQQKNLNVFVGAFLEENEIGVMTHYYVKSSLYELLIHDTHTVTDIILISLIYDLINALDFIHRTDIKYHGNLTSKSCFVDSRWVLKIKEFGFHTLGEEPPTRLICNISSGSCLLCPKELWRSPEYFVKLLKSVSDNQKNDIFSFGVILMECFTNEGPWKCLETNPCLIVRQLKYNFESLKLNVLNDFDWDEYKLFDIMINCLQFHAKDRWNIQKIKKKLKIIMHENSIKPNVMDNIINAMSYHTKSLEKEVKSKSLEIENEKNLTDRLVERILPREIASQLSHGYPVEAEVYQQVTLFLSDIVGFTGMTSMMAPIDVVKFLNPLYTLFDNVVAKYDVYKIETIGDAYMVASGVPKRNGDLHAYNICRMACELLSTIERFPKLKIDGVEHKIKLRVGIHTGTIVAGVVGKKMPRYCLFGETVQITHKLEQTSDEMKIQISEATYKIIMNSIEFKATPANEIDIRDGEKIKTFWIQKK
ncbi:Atrial natriuretic peptide receptor 1 [Thelohanellus kitauei]|uniref:guanylate cyclase n=1 Tax=Thelohanellus kitauei TaxID=669202 RepID=A0A0C2N702_THEKT|nr:Atrial natriuretic peptide receptor 1 [Thelohanellus kitauei]